jgi:hypothetical protein
LDSETLSVAMRPQAIRRKLTYAALACVLFVPWVASSASSLLQINFSNLVSRADLQYDGPTARSEDGLPVGNGRMGSLVWTTPSALKFQINRVDVFANNSASDSFPARHTDYCNGAGFVDIEFADFGAEVFSEEQTWQHLSCYEGVASVAGSGVKTRVLAWHEKDVMAVEVNDQRTQPGSINVNLRMLRAPFVRTLSHTATSKLEARDRTILLTQEFAEGDYFCGSVVGIRVLGREAEVRRANDTEWRLVVKPGQGTFTVLIASAASFQSDDNLRASAVAYLDAAADKEFAGLLEANRDWWRDFWSKSFIHLRSADGVAEFLEQHYTYYLYLMASTSRGKIATKFNGMLWNTDGDRRQWGKWECRPGSAPVH